MAQLKYWVWLSSKTGIKPAACQELISHFGTLENLYYAERGDYLKADGITGAEADILGDKSFETADRIFEACDRGQIKLMTMQDAEYPDRLKNIGVPPILLYYKGTMPVFDEEAAIAVIGTRKCTAYGVTAAERLAHDIAAGGGYIVSGMAAGLDSAAHIGALKAGKMTAAVLGGGVDVVYPPENRQLYEDIIASGVVISEYPPGTRPLGIHFPVRNRIMSGLSLGVLVVEAPRHSGTNITANYALEEGRDVFAVPGSIYVRESEGANNLIKSGAKLVSDAWDVLSEYTNVFPHKILITGRGEGADRAVISNTMLTVKSRAKDRKNDTPEKEEEPRAPLSEKIKDFTECRRKIIVSIADIPKQVDDIMGLTGLSLRDVLAELTLLELDGIVVSFPGKRHGLSDLFLK
ncbi:MAG: DNA-processing protein DprA [Oscillospiraceae bacterium]|jgi:DNA processing protein|nr:DNA-processing protein DprA [Oscillospiraceae bacterium]